ncbi:MULTISPECIES: MFS transporter [unclassified Treponema]|uniref:MFS transporter n=1 Tax=unclassified Treponema TaxID=2638727 RepID=UPI0020A441E3|nr:MULTISPECIES: MFS transporter [unclassified Treponema]UTC66426.1 MFS transporter [Treponema sp. OMZ 789]UTC69157.1 MFS transporter [Treponema sp. OMZ 790]UTC71870.1 MFS transporter [Treponema sp. OMZ 791]
MLNKQKKMTWRTYLAYGAADLYGGGCFFIVTTFAMYYLVNVIGLHPVLAGLIPAIGKFWDAVSDPMMGYIADNTPQNRFGKRRVWFLVSIVPIALSFIIIWFPTGIESQAGKFIFYTVAYIIFFTVSTVSYIPYAALSAEITKDFSERNKLNGSRLMFSFIATLLGGLLAQPIIDAFHGSMMGYFVMSIVFALIFALPWIPLYFETWELPEEKPQKKSEVKFIKNFLSLFKSRSCRIHIAMYVCSYGALDIVMSLVLFYIVDYLNRGSVFVIAQGSLLITMMATLPIHNRIINKRGHKPVYVAALIIFAVSIVLMSFHTPQTNPVFLILNMVLMGVGISANNLIPHQLLPFLADIDKLMSGENRAGTYSAAMTLTRKLFLGLVIMTTIGFVLSGIGYKNPVPSVLTQKQFKEAQDLAVKHNENFENINKYYSLREDGNFHLKYMSRNTDKIISSIDKKVNDNFDEIPEAVFESLLSSFNAKDFNETNDKFLLESSYLKSGDVYKKIMPQDFYTKDDLYDLKELLDKIDFKYSGIGQVQKPQQKDSTLRGVKIAFIIMPLFMILFGIFFGLKFNVSPENHKIILDELSRLEAGGKKEDADEKTKQVCELLIGEPYGRT